MSIFTRIWSGSEADEEMARASAKALDNEKIDTLVGQLKKLVRDADALQLAIDSLDADSAFSAGEVVEISYRFLGGTKPKSRKSAIAALGKERLRLSHARAKTATAAKSRTW
jgi:hypothetical protein